MCRIYHSCKFIILHLQYLIHVITIDHPSEISHYAVRVNSDTLTHLVVRAVCIGGGGGGVPDTTFTSHGPGEKPAFWPLYAR